MENVFVKINNFGLIGKGDSFIEINPYTLNSKEVNLSKINPNLVIDFDKYNSMFSLFSDYSITEKVQTIKDTIRELTKGQSYPSSESLVNSIKRTLELRNANYQAALRRNVFYASFK